MIYLQCEAEVRHRAARIAAEATTPGGWFVAEGFAPNHDGNSELGPKNDELLYDRDGILAAVDGMQIVEDMRGWVRLDEGIKHQGTGWVLRILARHA